jgi:hypothetical protein
MILPKKTIKPSEQLEKLFEIAQAAHVMIQRDFKEIDPLIGVSQNMRASGIPADVMTVDCLKTRRRIIFILHDHQPDLLSYQFGEMDSDPVSDFKSVELTEMTEQTFYDWVTGYFKEQ